MPQRKILLLDIETLPNMDEVIKIFPSLSDYPGKTLKATVNTIICFGYKWHGEMKKAKCLNVWDYSKDMHDDKKLCEEIIKLVNEADAVVTHNGKRFDWKFIQTRIIKHKLQPLPKIPHIDTCMLARSNLMAYNNKLNTIGELTDSGVKLSHEGWNLWVKVSKGDRQAMDKMTKYCKQDVDLLEKVFVRLRPFAANIPNANLYSNFEKDQCPYCESTLITKHGTKLTKVNIMQRWLCKQCGATHSKPKDNAIPRTY